MHYEIPGEDFPQNDLQPKHDPALEGRRLISEAIKYMRSLHEQGYSIPEIAKWCRIILTGVAGLNLPLPT